MKFFLFLLLVPFYIHSLAQASDAAEKKQILKLLASQRESWNKGDLDGYMQTYWKSDSLLFLGKNGIKTGWNTAFENYKTSYPDTVAMGKLNFGVIEIKKLSQQYYYLVGKWILKRSAGNISGIFDILIRKINGRWYIIADHSS